MGFYGLQISSASYLSSASSDLGISWAPGGLGQKPFLSAAGAGGAGGLPLDQLSALHQKFGGDASATWRDGRWAEDWEGWKCGENHGKSWNIMETLEIFGINKTWPWDAMGSIPPFFMS